LLGAHYCGPLRPFFSLGRIGGGRTAESGVTRIHNELRPTLQACTSLKTPGVYEIRLVHVNTWLCKSARRFANLQSALHINKRLCTYARGSAHMHELEAHVQSAVFMCKVVCVYAARRVHDVQQRVHLCTAVCSFADPSARVHHRVFIGSGPCMYARRRVYFAKGRVYVQSVVLVCTRLCLCAARRVYFARPHARVHVAVSTVDGSVPRGAKPLALRRAPPRTGL